MDLTSLLTKLRRNPLAGLALAMVLLIIAVNIRLWTSITLFYVTFYPAIILATIAGGWWLGVGAMLVATACVNFFFVSPYWAFSFGTSDILNAVAFWAVCLFIIALTDYLVTLLMTANERAQKLTDLYERLAESEKQRKIVMRELSHRMKNQYSVILAMARATESNAQSVAQYRAAFVGRLQSMSRAHDLLTVTGWVSASLIDLAKSTLEPFAEQGRATIAGGDVTLKEHAVVNLGMAIHELATNCAKHGAWSGPDGHVTLSWEVSGGNLTFKWQERDGPGVHDDGTRGFGRTILETIVPSALNGTAHLDFAPEGFTWTLTVPDSCLETAPD